MTTAAGTPQPLAPTTTDLVVVAPQGVAVVAEAPAAIASRAMQVAEQLKGILDRGELTIRIGGDGGKAGREFVRIEGWQAIGSMLGLSTVTEWTRPIMAADESTFGWEAKVTLLDPNGRPLASGEAMVARDENTWRSRSEYALRSMAQTRAAGKAYRSAFGWIMSMAGYAATPAEEVDGTDQERSEPAAAQRAPARPPQQRNATQAARAPRAQQAATVATAATGEAPAQPLPAAPKSVGGYFEYCKTKYGYDEAKVFEIHDAKTPNDLREKGLSALMEEVQVYYDTHKPGGTPVAAPAEEPTDGEFREVETSPPPDEDAPPPDDLPLE